MNLKSFKLSSVILLSLSVVMFFFSCSEEDIISPQKNDKRLQIYKFKDTKEYNKTMEKVLSYSLEELIDWENSNGIASYGRICDEFYASIDFSQFKARQEIIDFVDLHSNYLQLEENENGELMLETKLCNNPNRYVINNQMMFQVGDSLFKVFENGISTSHVTNYEKLNKLDDRTFNLKKSQVKTHKCIPIEPSIKGTASNCGTSDDDYESSGNNRTHMWISCSYEHIWDYVMNRPAGTWVETYYKVRPYKRTLGIWYWSTRTISCDINTAIEFYINGSWYSENLYGGVLNKRDSKVEGTYGFWASSGYFSVTSIYFAEYDCWADTPSSPEVNLECN